MGYCRTIKEIDFIGTQEGNILYININTNRNENSLSEISENNLNGLTFYVSNPADVRIKINGREINDFKQNPPDYTGRSSVSLAWPVLEFPKR